MIKICLRGISNCNDISPEKKNSMTNALAEPLSIARAILGGLTNKISKNTIS